MFNIVFTTMHFAYSPIIHCLLIKIVSLYAQFALCTLRFQFNINASVTAASCDTAAKFVCVASNDFRVYFIGRFDGAF